jgi:hypothetical protein
MSKVSVTENSPVYHIKLNREEAECLMALMFCNLRNYESSPLFDLYLEMQKSLKLYVGTGIGVLNDDLEKLAKQYREYVRGRYES